MDGTAYAVIKGGREACRLNQSFDIVSAPPDPVDTITTSSRVRLAVWLRGLRDSAYGLLMPVLFWSGLAAMLVSTTMMGARRAATDPILLLAGSTWVLMFSLIMLLALITATGLATIDYRHIRYRALRPCFRSGVPSSDSPPRPGDAADCVKRS